MEVHANSDAPLKISGQMQPRGHTNIQSVYPIVVVHSYLATSDNGICGFPTGIIAARSMFCVPGPRSLLRVNMGVMAMTATCGRVNGRSIHEIF